jgi:hypothetical protein
MMIRCFVAFRYMYMEAGQFGFLYGNDVIEVEKLPTSYEEFSRLESDVQSRHHEKMLLCLLDLPHPLPIGNDVNVPILTMDVTYTCREVPYSLGFRLPVPETISDETLASLIQDLTDNTDVLILGREPAT